jgi:hypothetical protein
MTGEGSAPTAVDALRAFVAARLAEVPKLIGEHRWHFEGGWVVWTSPQGDKSCVPLGVTAATFATHPDYPGDLSGPADG